MLPRLRKSSTPSLPPSRGKCGRWCRPSDDVSILCAETDSFTAMCMRPMSGSGIGRPNQPSSVARFLWPTSFWFCARQTRLSGTFHRVQRPADEGLDHGAGRPGPFFHPGGPGLSPALRRSCGKDARSACACEQFSIGWAPPTKKAVLRPWSNVAGMMTKGRVSLDDLGGFWTHLFREDPACLREGHLTTRG